MSVNGVISERARSGRQQAAPTRRRFLAGAGAGLLALAGLPSPVRASGREVPILEWLSLRVVTDDAVSAASQVRRLPDLTVEEIGDTALRGPSDAGFALHAQSIRHTEMRSVLFDFGCARDALDSNLQCLRISPAAIDQVVASQSGSALARLPLLGSGADAPALIADHGFASLRSLPAAKAFEPTMIRAQAAGEEATPASAMCQPQRADVTVSFLLVCRGLVVVTSCDHRALIGSIREAQAACGVTKVYAVMVGSRAVSAADDDIRSVASELAAIAPDYVAIAHGSGEPLFTAADAAMPGRVIRTTAGMRLKFAI